MARVAIWACGIAGKLLLGGASHYWLRLKTAHTQANLPPIVRIKSRLNTHPIALEAV